VAADVTGTARLGRRTKDLVKRLRIGDVAIIDHADLDRVSAEELVASGVRAVVNVASSSSGRFPNPGPLELVRAGVRLIDVAGTELFDEVSDGETVSVRGGGVWRNGSCLAVGVELDEHTLVTALGEQESRVTDALEAFADNTLRHLRDEGRLLTEGIEFPPLKTKFRDRHAVVVVRGPGYKRDLRIVRPYIRDFRPVLVAVDGGADALLEIGLKPHVIVGDFDSVSDTALRAGAELLVHAYADGRAPGSERLRALGLAFHTVSAPGISEDIALQLAHQRGAELIVAVGTHATLVEFLDKGRAGMASTFLTRLRVGGKLVDAKGVSRLYRSRVSTMQVTMLVLVGLFALSAALWSTPSGNVVLGLLGARYDDLVSWIQGLS
jgi:uncharacterized membrane-anchored protein